VSGEEGGGGGAAAAAGGEWRLRLRGLGSGDWVGDRVRGIGLGFHLGRPFYTDAMIKNGRMRFAVKHDLTAGKF
jgi:hypothetical protein